MKKYLILLFLAVLASCTKDLPDDLLPADGRYSMTVQASKEGTKALGFSDGKLNATWTEGDVVKVYQGNNEIGELSAQSTGTPTTLRGELTVAPSANDVLTLKFLSPSYASQNGTLEYIESHCDYAEATVTVKSIDGGNITIKESSASFVNQQAIVKFTLKQSGGAALSSNPTALDINYGTGIITLSDIPDDTYTNLKNGNGVLYVAIPDVSDGIVGLTAICGSDYYIYSKNSVTLQAGDYYEITVKMIPATIVNLATVSENTTLTDGQVAIGTLANNVQISIADDATVTLHNVNINGNGTWTSGMYAGITCEGDAHIILSGNNILKGFHEFRPGILPGPTGSTLTISGTGSLTASSNGRATGIGNSYSGYYVVGDIIITGGTITAYGGYYCAGIGAGVQNTCGNITITGGIVTAYGGRYAAGIGTGVGREGYEYDDPGVDPMDPMPMHIEEEDEPSVCGTITISGGTVVATGGQYGAGIGTGKIGNCGNITIYSSVTSVTATKGSGAQHSIGRGVDNDMYNYFPTHGLRNFSVTIGGSNVGYISESPYTYQP